MFDAAIAKQTYDDRSRRPVSAVRSNAHSVDQDHRREEEYVCTTYGDFG